MENQRQFLDKIEAFLTEHKMKPTVFSKNAVGYPSFVRTVRLGLSPRLTTVEKVLNFMRQGHANDP